MKVLLVILTILLVLATIVGSIIKEESFALGEKIIGFSVLFGVIVYLPLFLYLRWKGKKLEDYVLTKKNLKKLRSRKE